MPKQVEKESRIKEAQKAKVQEYRQRIEAEKQELLSEERRKAAEGQKLLRELIETKRNRVLQKMDELLEIRQQQSLSTIKAIDGSASVNTSASLEY